MTVELSNSSIEHWFMNDFLPKYNNTLIGVPFGKVLEELNKVYYGNLSTISSNYLRVLYDEEISQGPEGYFG